MAEQPSVFARQMSETKKQVLAKHANTIMESRTRRLQLLRAVDLAQVQKLIDEAQIMIQKVASDHKAGTEVLILTFVDNEVMRPPDQVQWCLPHSDWIRGNYREVFRHFDKEGFKPEIREWQDQKNLTQGYAIWVKIPMTRPIQ